jgi:heptosyltransferase-2
MRLAVLKPDHFGDLILASAAIRAVLGRHPQAAVFVQGGNLALARALFGPQTDLRRADFPHLAKQPSADAALPDFAAFDLVLCLRRDDVIDEAWALDRCRDFLLPVDTFLDHQSVIDYAVASRLVGPYDIDALHFGAALPTLAAKAAAAPRSIGLCIGSGFHANAWPLTHWIALGQLLRRADCVISLVHGPKEQAAAGVIARALQLPAAAVIAGGDDIAATRARIATLDWVVASDGGAAHLCGLEAPVVSIFGPSPFRRYAPLGRWNRLLTQELDCSPCCQWARGLINGCLTTECMVGIAPSVVLAALADTRLARADPGACEVAAGVRLHLGVSHLDLARKRAERIDFFAPAPQYETA